MPLSLSGSFCTFQKSKTWSVKVVKKHPPAGEEASLVADFPTTATLFGAGVGNTLQERARLKRSFGGWWGRVADRRLIRYWRASLFMMHTRQSQRPRPGECFCLRNERKTERQNDSNEDTGHKQDSPTEGCFILLRSSPARTSCGTLTCSRSLVAEASQCRVALSRRNSQAVAGYA